MAVAIAPAVAAALNISLTSATIVSSAALLAGTTALQYFIAKSQEVKGPQDRGQKLEVALGSAVPQSIGFGEYETAGHLYYAGTWGRAGMRDNNFAVEAYILADLPGEGEKGTFWYGGQKCNIDLDTSYSLDGVNLGHPVTTLRKGGRDYVWVKFHDGTQAAADTYLRAKFGGLAKRPYTSNMVGYGRPLAIVTVRYNKDAPSGIQEQLFVYKGSKWYDPRKDSTNGGAGSHRWGVRSTYEYSQNRAVIYYNIRRGIYYDGSRLYGGLNYPAYMLDNDSYFAAMNACDENMTLAGGGTEKRFLGGGEIDLSVRVTETLNRLLVGMNGHVVEDGGVSRLYVGTGGASVMSITDGDMIATEREEGDECPHPDDIFNTVITTYTEPQDAGQQASTRKRTDPDALERDGEEITTSMDLPWVRSNTQAQRIAKHALKEAQRWRKRTIVLPPYARKLRPCDVITWTSADEGWTNKKWICGDVMLRKNSLVQVRLRELDPTDYDWSPDDEDPFDYGEYDDVTPDAESFAATITAVPMTDDAGSARRCAIRFEPSSAVLGSNTWADIASEFEDFTALLWQVRKKNGTQKTIAKGRSDAFFEDGEDEVTKNTFVPELQVQVRYRIELANGRLTGWSGWTDLTLSNTDSPDVNNAPPPDLASAPTIALRTRTHRSGLVRQRLLIGLDLTGRDPKESYRIRVVDTTESPSESQRFKTDEFPYSVVVQDGHSYTVTVAPVSRFGVVGNFSSAATGVSMPIVKKSGGVPSVSGETATAGHRRNVIEWDPVDRDAYPDYDETEIQRANDSLFSVGLKTHRRKSSSFNDVGLGNAAQRYYRIRHLDSSGNPGAWSATLSPTTTRLDTDDYSTASVQTSNIKPNAVIEGNKANIPPADGNWTVAPGDNSKHTRHLFSKLNGGVASIDNDSQSPVLVNWSISAEGSVEVTGGSKGYVAVDATVKIKHINSGTTKVLGKIKFGAGKAAKVKFVNSIFFPIADGNTAKFDLTIDYRKQQAGITGKAKFAITGTITMTRWKR